MGFLRAQQLKRARQAVQHMPFVEQRRFRAVEILGLLVRIEGTAAEADDGAAAVFDREHQPIAETVVGRLALDLDQQATFDQFGNLGALLHQGILQRRLLARRIAQAEGRHVLVGQAALFQVVARRLRAGMAVLQARGEPFRRQFHPVGQAALVDLDRLGLGRHHRQRHAGVARQAFDGFVKRQPLGLHDEVDDVAVLTRREVEILPLRVVDVEGRRLFLGEWA